MFQHKPKTLYNWYKNVISDFRIDKEEGRYMAHKVYACDVKTGEVKKEKVVHIVQPHNVGTSMCIDEKMINKQYHTIVSNQQTGKIALLIDSVKPILVRQSIELLGEENLSKIQYMNSDMSPVMKKICSDTIPKASIVIDKFHVVKHIMDAINQVRLNIKSTEKSSKIPISKNPNGWTNVELLEKVRYLLFKMATVLKEEEKQLLYFVLNKYPTLKKAYYFVQEIRNWYDKRNIGASMITIQTKLHQWIEKVRTAKIKAFNVIVNMFNTHYQDILRYFEKGLTNAKAENLNGKIQRFLTNNYGTRDKDFFFYRVQLYFAAPEKKN